MRFPHFVEFQVKQAIRQIPQADKCCKSLSGNTVLGVVAAVQAAARVLEDALDGPRLLNSKITTRMREGVIYKQLNNLLVFS